MTGHFDCLFMGVPKGPWGPPRAQLARGQRGTALVLNGIVEVPAVAFAAAIIVMRLWARVGRLTHCDRKESGEAVKAAHLRSTPCLRMAAHRCLRFQPRLSAPNGGGSSSCCDGGPRWK